ncbi:unnamed protein product [Protopolystoma xenopodis]|uniref:Uncharacterized protein n=1 Tax=Protopolystoma xenopodis TaxID=117903 RepID=A0A448WXX7_9PLAT|nr:unnamed protein product [Protopolystoma xenopodis]
MSGTAGRSHLRAEAVEMTPSRRFAGTRVPGAIGAESPSNRDVCLFVVLPHASIMHWCPCRSVAVCWLPRSGSRLCTFDQQVCRAVGVSPSDRGLFTLQVSSRGARSQP